MRYTVCEAQKVCEWYEDFYECCTNCFYFGGLMCGHIDSNGKCLGWKPVKKFDKEEIKMYNKIIELMRKDFNK